MEQKEVIHKISVGSNMTVRATVQLLDQIESWLSDAIKSRINTTMVGEQPLYKLLNNSNSPLTSELVNESVSLDKLKEYLNEQGLAFAFKENKDGSRNLFFKVQDKELAFKALENVKNDMLSNPDGVANKIVKDPNKVTFAEKVSIALEDQRKLPKQNAPEIKANTPEIGGVK